MKLTLTEKGGLISGEIEIGIMSFVKLGIKKAGFITNPALQPSTTNRFYNPKNYEVIAMNYLL